MIDQAVVGIYLVSVLAYGLYKGRDVKDFKDYSIGARRFSSPVVVATLTATVIGGGSTIGAAAQYYTMGILILMGCCLDAVGIFLVSKFLIPHMHRFRGALSIGEVFQKHYGKGARLSIGVLGVLFNVGIIAAQVSATGYLFQDFLGIPYELGVCIAFGVIVAYSAFGGFRAVVATDIVQFAILIIAIPLIANYVIHIVGGYSALIEALPASRLTFWPSTEAVLKYWPAFLGFLVPPLSPPFFHRMLMSNNTQLLRSSFRTSAILAVPSALIICIIGLAGSVLYPNIEPHTVLPHIIGAILPVGIKGLAISGLLAVVMSTADSALNSASVMLVNDVIKPIGGREDYNFLRITRLGCLALGLASVLIALQFTVIFDLIRYSWMVWSPVVIPPLVMLFFGKSVQKRVFLSGALAAVAVAFSWTWIIQTHFTAYIEAFFPALFMNCAVLYLFGRRVDVPAQPACEAAR